MTTEPPSLDHTAEAALAWFARLRAAPADAALRAEFERWRAGAPERTQAYAAVEALWDSSSLATALHALEPTLPRVPPARRSPRLAWAAAATVALAVGLASWFDLPLRWRADAVAAVGEQRELTLADGSRLTLGSGAAVIIDVTQAHRRIELLRGDLYLRAARDARRPLLVNAGAARVKVVGTAFAVARRDGAAVVTVREGLVQVDAGGQGALLRAGEQVRAGVQLGAVADVDVDAALGWVQGRLIFHDQPLAVVLAELERHYSGLIVAIGDDVRGRQVSGNYRLDDPPAVVAALAQIAGVDVSRIGSRLLILH